MGAYLAVIGAADQVFQGTYLWKDRDWKQSVACKMAGFLSLLSSEVSAFIICLITLDRFLVLRFPFSQRHFKRHTALMASAMAFFFGFLIALVPLLPAMSYWEFYGQTGICIPLPITRKAFPGQGYSFGIMIVLNFILFLVIAVGQLVIFWSIRANTMNRSNSTSASRDLAIAQRLAIIVVSDFLCWFPIGVLGLLASRGMPIPGEVSVGMAIFVLPLNSALNPFLYTVNAVLAKRRERQHKEMMKAVESRIRSEMASGLHVPATVSEVPRRGADMISSGLRVASPVQVPSCASRAVTVEVGVNTSEFRTGKMASEVIVDTSIQMAHKTNLSSEVESNPKGYTSLKVENVPKGKITQEQIYEMFGAMNLSRDEISHIRIKMDDDEANTMIRLM